MNWDQVKGQMKQVSALVKQKWAKLTDDDLKLLEGKKDAFLGRVQQKYGLMKEEAERHLDELLRQQDQGPQAPTR